uniref:Uncharacterized protein n=1 Tax=Arundo donax TaxID=35708 RepID=A0A0A9C839_ARUDO
MVTTQVPTRTVMMTTSMLSQTGIEELAEMP